MVTYQVDHREHGVQVQFEELADLIHELKWVEKGVSESTKMPFNDTFFSFL